MEFYQIILTLAVSFVLIYIGYLIGKFIQNKKWEEMTPDIRADAIKQSRAVLGGQFSEQLAPYLPDFPYSPTECRFIRKPIDFIVFKGMDNKDIGEVKFIEVKSGKSQLSQQGKTLRDAVKNKRVSWEEYRIPEDVTKKREDKNYF